MSTWNAANVARAYRACLIGLVLVMLSASLADADFGPRTTIGTNYQQTSSTQSTNAVNPSFCHDRPSCFVLFQQIPQRKPLIVQHASCRVSVRTGGLLQAYLGTRKDDETLPHKNTYLVPVHTSGTFWMVNSPVMHLLNSGERPFIFLHNSVSSTEWFVACNISGQLPQL